MATATCIMPAERVAYTHDNQTRNPMTETICILLHGTARGTRREHVLSAFCEAEDSSRASDATLGCFVASPRMHTHCIQAPLRQTRRCRCWPQCPTALHAPPEAQPPLHPHANAYWKLCAVQRELSRLRLAPICLHGHTVQHFTAVSVPAMSVVIQWLMITLIRP
jgi:hypothetical protein